MEIKKDCFAYKASTNKCTCLNENYCEKGICNFYQPTSEEEKEDFRRELREALKKYQETHK